MDDMTSEAATERSFLAPRDARIPAARLGVAVVHDLVSAIVLGEVPAGSSLPPEGNLSAHFGVSRTIIRESVKRLEEKGLVTVVQGRGTEVHPSTSWNILDPIVLGALLENDDALGVLDEVTVVRSSLEGAMSAETALRRHDAELDRLRGAYRRMEETLADPAGYADADAEFHYIVMELSNNRLAESIVKTLFQGARTSSRFSQNQTDVAFRATLDEHRLVLNAIERGDSVAAENFMRRHIVDAWQRRRLPNAKRGQLAR